MRILCLLAFLITGPVWTAAHACGPDSDCTLGERTYRLDTGDRPAEGRGALIFMHGYKGSAKGTMRNKALRAFADEQGLVLVAANADASDWQIPGVPADPGADGTREYRYFDALVRDLETRHGIDKERLVLSGFSAGAMMVWELACQRGASFSAFIPVAGTFWDPVPQTCPSPPVHLVHIHGTSDKIVPIEGRPIRTTRQGHVLVAIDRLVERGDYEHEVTQQIFGDLDCKTGRNPDGKVLGFCTHPGGHSIKMDYLRAAFRILAERGSF